MDALKKVIYEAKKKAFKSITPPESLRGRLVVEFDDEKCEIRLKLKKKRKTNE